MRLVLALGLAFVLGLFVSMAHAAPPADQTHALMTPEEQEIRERAKKRLYPGGQDEDRLKVQSQLSQATRKMGPATEAPEAEPADAATD